jgi:hypothetical protein
MALPGHRQGHLFDIHQLAAEVGMLGPIAVVGIEVTLGVEKGDEHGSLKLSLRSACFEGAFQVS